MKRTGGIAAGFGLFLLTASTALAFFGTSIQMIAFGTVQLMEPIDVRVASKNIASGTRYPGETLGSATFVVTNRANVAYGMMYEANAIPMQPGITIQSFEASSFDQEKQSFMQRLQSHEYVPTSNSVVRVDPDGPGPMPYDTITPGKWFTLERGGVHYVWVEVKSGKSDSPGTMGLLFATVRGDNPAHVPPPAR